MKKIITILSLFVAIALIGCSAHNGNAKGKVFGTEPTLKEPVSIAAVNSEPAKFKDQDVLVTGKVVAMCQHMGCWVEIEQADKSTIICKSVDESVHFTQDVMGKDIELQGTLLWDEAAPGEVKESHEGGEAHACPAPKVMVSLKGARVKGI
ncbi:DUF4920 domain-containing protein [candidate division KSB1 bacterium]|nr:DUF4920 domain-containing protein [candidate division KSB1 bacterium]